eukprot:9279912-Alexandrium_andersonii.AAC.1
MLTCARCWSAGFRLVPPGPVGLDMSCASHWGAIPTAGSRQVPPSRGERGRMPYSRSTNHDIR